METLRLSFSSPFISITDFTTPEQAKRMLEIFEQSDSRRRKLGIGVMMSRKTLNKLPTKWSAAFPKNDTIGSIFLRHPMAFNVLHYADYSHETTRGDLEKAIRLGGENLHGIQLDMPWPDPNMIQDAHIIHPGPNLLNVIIQIGTVAFEGAGNNPDVVVERLLPYHERCILQYVLLDRSMGQGRLIDPESMFPFIDAIRSAYPEVFVVVAGGLGPETIERVRPIIERYPKEISIDAQGRLRQSGNALDPIDWDMAETYLTKALNLFSQVEG